MPNIDLPPFFSRRARLALVAFVVAVVAGCNVAEALAGQRLARPPLPSPMPPIVHGPCPGMPDAGACWDGTAVYVDAFDVDDRDVLRHELGHAFDTRHLDDAERAALARLLGRRGVEWCDVGAWQARADEDTRHAPPCEQFADAYANCRTGARVASIRFVYGYGYAPTPRQHRRVCAAITRYAD